MSCISKQTNKQTKTNLDHYCVNILSFLYRVCALLVHCCSSFVQCLQKCDYLGNSYYCTEFMKLYFQIKVQYINIHSLKFRANIPRNKRAGEDFVAMGANANLFPGTQEWRKY